MDVGVAMKTIANVTEGGLTSLLPDRAAASEMTPIADVNSLLIRCDNSRIRSAPSGHAVWLFGSNMASTFGRAKLDISHP